MGLLWATVFAQASWGHGDRHEHLARVDAKIEANPDSLRFRFERAEALRRLGHYEESLVDLDRVLALSPDNGHVHYLRGLTHFDRGEYGDAETSLRRYVDSVPESPSAHTALAETLIRQGRHREAGDEYSRAIAVHPTPAPDLYVARARAYRAAGAEFQGLAIRGLDDAMASLGPLVTLQRLAIEIERDRGNHAGALGRIDEVLADVPRKESWLAYKGRVLASTGREQDAVDAFRLAQAALESLPPRVRSSPAMVSLAETIATQLENHLNSDAAP
ncbi:MAG: tetratricopeptide repeat protein [Gammaproteobacteria bacterium]|nr:tetratricopeptide repeat protein [Gammaproteobacteria bacterium]